MKRLLNPMLAALAVVVILNVLGIVLLPDYLAFGLFCMACQVTGILVFAIVLLRWPPADPFDVDLDYPDAGDTHQHLEDTEAACAVAPAVYIEPRIAPPLCGHLAQRPGEEHAAYRRRLAEHYALTFPLAY